MLKTSATNALALVYTISNYFCILINTFSYATIVCYYFDYALKISFKFSGFGRVSKNTFIISSYTEHDIYLQYLDLRTVTAFEKCHSVSKIANV